MKYLQLTMMYYILKSMLSWANNLVIKLKPGRIEICFVDILNSNDWDSNYFLKENVFDIYVVES